MANDFTLEQPFWFSVHTVRTEINVLQHIAQYSQAYLSTHSAMENAVQKYLNHILNPSTIPEQISINGVTGDIIDAEIQFVARVHLLHPLDYEKHQQKHRFESITLTQLHRIDTFKQTLFTGAVKTKATRFANNVPELFDWLMDACIRHQDFLSKVIIFKYYDEEKLKILMAQYYQFLRVKKVYPEQLVVPSNDQDLLWHLHLLDHTKYKQEVTKYTGVFLNHDDNIVQEKLDRSYKETNTLMIKLKNRDQESFETVAAKLDRLLDSSSGAEEENVEYCTPQRICSYTLCGIGLIFVVVSIIYAIKAQAVSEYEEKLEDYFNHQDSGFKYVGPGYCRASTTKIMLRYNDKVFSQEKRENDCQEFCLNDTDCVGYTFAKNASRVTPIKDERTGHIFEQPTPENPHRCIKYAYIDIRCGITHSKAQWDTNYRCKCRTDQNDDCVGLPDLCSTKDFSLIFGIVSIFPIFLGFIVYIDTLLCCKENCPDWKSIECGGTSGSCGGRSAFCGDCGA